METAEPASAESLQFGALLKRYRVAAGLSQEGLAERAGVSARAISAYECGERQSPYRDTMALLVHALALSPNEAAMLEAGVPCRRGPAGAPAQPAPLEPLPLARTRLRLLPPAGGYVPPLVGRADELAALERHLAGEGPPVLVLAGEPGIGKTRLLREAVWRAEVRGWTVLHGGCRRRGGQAPYAPLLEVLARHLSPQSAERQREDLQGCAWLVRLLPELAGCQIEPPPAWQLAPEQERRLMFGAVERFLTNIAGSAGTLLALDDLQWADPDALDLLASVIWSTTSTPVRVIGAYRDTEARTDSPLVALLADLAQADWAEHRTLCPLSERETEQLLDHLLEQVDAERVECREQLSRRLGGVPFFLVSYVRGLRAGAPVSENGMPWILAQSLRQRVAALSESARDVISAAAVLGRIAVRSVLLAVVGRPEDEMTAALEAVCRARLMEEEGRDVYRFVHDIIREVVEADLSVARRVALHRRAAEVLEAYPPDGAIETLAYHCEQGESWAKALEYLAQAGDLARAACASQAAADYYSRAYAAAAKLGDAALPSALDVARKRGFAHFDMGDAAAAVPAFTLMGETAQRLGDRHLYGMALAHRGMASIEAHRFDLAVVRDTLALCERIGDYHARGSCLNVLGWIHGELQDHEGAVDLNSQSLRSALKRKSPDPECQHNARLNLGDSLMALGRLDEAAEQFQIVERTVRRPQPHEHYMLWRYSQHLFHSYGELRLARGDHDRAFALAGECLALAESSDSKKNIVKARRLRSQVLLARGKPEEATPEIEAALTMARKVGNPPQLWRTLTAFGDLLRANGSGEEAGQAYREALLVIETVAAALDDPALSNIFLSSEQVKRVRHQAGCGAD